MADVRTLMAAERQSRRITHPQLTYTKSGMLMCSVCHLNVKSESLWEGHLRSANHRKNTLAAQENAIKGLKRKIDDVEESWEDQEDADAEGRKKTKSRVGSISNESNNIPGEQRSIQISSEEEGSKLTTLNRMEDGQIADSIVSRSRSQISESIDVPSVFPTTSRIDEDEWAAFEREVAPLANADYSSATISAAPVSATEVEAQTEADKRRRLETEGEDEKEEEERRLEEEFDLMEEMEARVRKLKEKREALRKTIKADEDSIQNQRSENTEDVDKHGQSEDEGSQDDQDEVDDWYS